LKRQKKKEKEAKDTEDAEKKAKDEAEAKAKEEPPPVRGGMDDLRRIVAMIEKAIETNQSRIIGRALRHNGPLRHEATKEVLTEAVGIYVPEGDTKAALLAQIACLPETPPPPVAEGGAQAGSSGVAVAGAAGGEADKMDEDAPAKEAKTLDEPRTTILPEVEVYLSLLVLTSLLRHSELGAQSLDAAQALFLKVQNHNRRSLDLLRAKTFHYLSLATERAAGGGRAGGTQALAALRPTLLAAHRTACLTHDELGQATLLNLLLRSLLEEDLVEQAYKLVAKTNFPEKASNNQFCRYLYYTGRISALQLEYGDAYEKLKSSLRKAPQNPGVAGFRRSVQKLAVIVSLLMGEVPERAVFNQPDYKKALAPYLELTVAVREGNLSEFNKAVAAHKAVFVADKMHSLVVRLSHSVIKTGLRRINLSYSRISMADVCLKLALESPASASMVCAKAIRDGVIDAQIDHESGCLVSKERTNVYATNEPQRAFHQRVEFCLTVRNEAVRAMRYPADAFKPQPKKKEEPAKTEEEIAKEIEDELEEGDL